MSINSENNKRIAKNTMLLYVRMLFTMGVALYTSRVVLNTLGVEDFGIYNVVGGIVVMLSFLNGLTAATQRFLTFELGIENISKLKKIFATSILIHGIISITIFILAETIGLWFLYTQMKIPISRMDAALWVYQFSILSCIVTIMSAPYNATIIAHEKMSAFAYISVMEIVLKLLIVYVLILFSFDKLKLYAILMFSVQIISRIIYGWYCKKHFQETSYHLIWDKNLFKEMIGFSAWTLNGNLAVVTYTQGVNILLNIFFGSTVNAARGIAIQVQTAVMKFCSNFQIALNPQIIKSYATGDLKYMHQLIVSSSKYSFYLLFFLSLPILFETEQILKWWLKIVPDYTAIFIRIVLIITLLEALSNPMITAIHSTGKLKRFQLWEGSILLLILPVSYLTLKIGFPPQSVFFVHLILAIVAQYIRIRIVSPMIQMPLKSYFQKVIINITYVSLCSLLLPVCLYLYLPPHTASFFIICTACVLSTTSAIYYVGLDDAEKELIKKRLCKHNFKKKK